MTANYGYGDLEITDDMIRVPEEHQEEMIELYGLLAHGPKVDIFVNRYKFWKRAAEVIPESKNDDITWSTCFSTNQGMWLKPNKKKDE